MGKIKKPRKKYHISVQGTAPKRRVSTLESSNEINNTSTLSSSPTDNVFAGLNISFDSLNKTLPKDFDIQSVTSVKSRKEMKEEEQHLKKKDKKKLRHDRFMKKIDFMQQAMKEEKARKKRGKVTATLGDMLSMADALPTLKVIETTARSIEEAARERRTMKHRTLSVKKRHKQHLHAIKDYRRVLNDNSVRNVALDLSNNILDKLRTKITAEREDTT